MKTNGKVVLVVLMVSLAANVYLFATRPQGPRLGDRVITTQSRPADRLAGAIPSARVDPGARETASEAGTSSTPGAHDREATLTGELLKCQADLDQRLPLSERYQRSSERSPEIEEQVRPTLERVFATKPGAKPVYTVECHGTICSIKVDDDQDVDTWMKALQNGPNDVLRSFMFGRAGTFVEAGSPEYTAGSRYVQSVFAVIRSSPAVAECKRRFPSPGSVTISVVLDAARHVVVKMEGELADKELGACLRPILDQAPSQVPPPPENLASLPYRGMVIGVPRPDQVPVERRSGIDRLAASTAHGQ